MPKPLSPAAARRSFTAFAEHVGASIVVRPWVDDKERELPDSYAVPTGLSLQQKQSRMEDLQAELGDCERCGLCEHRRRERDDGETSHIVFGAGSVDADIAILGEGPGAAEEITGIPFVDFDKKRDRAGKMLTAMLTNVLEIPRERVYILNTIKCRAPDNRTPSEDEVEACEPFWQRQLRIVQPKVILALGRSAANALLQCRGGVRQIRGSWGEWEGIPAMATFHPAFLMRQRAAARKKAIAHAKLLGRPIPKRAFAEEDRYTQSDLLMVKKKFNELGGWR